VFEVKAGKGVSTQIYIQDDGRTRVESTEYSNFTVAQRHRSGNYQESGGLGTG
jgi:hypothetical protein